MTPNSNGMVSIIIDDQLSNIGGVDRNNGSTSELTEISIDRQKLVARLNESSTFEISVELTNIDQGNRPINTPTHTTSFAEFYYEAKRISANSIIRGISKIDDDNEIKDYIINEMERGFDYIIEFEWEGGDTFNWYFWTKAN